MKTTKGRTQLASDIEDLPLLIDAVQDYAIFGLGPNGEIRSWNQGAARIMGYEASEIVGRNFTTFYGPEDLANRKPQRELEVARDEGRVQDEGWRVRKDGTKFWANTVITALRNDDGSIRGFTKVTRDLTERREADERLRQSEEIFRLLVASVKDYAIFLLDPNGNIATWNAGAEAIKGWKANEIIGKHFSIFYPEKDKYKPEMELRIARAEGRFEEEGIRVRKDGSTFWANVVITAVRDEHGTLRGFTKVTRDITERKHAEEMQMALMEQREARLQAEEQRRHAEASFRAAQEANQAKDEFLMTLSHELRTPMTAIMGWSRLLPTLPPTDPIVPQALASIARSADLQAQLIDDVLDVSRIVSGKLRLDMQNVDVTQVLNSALEAVRPSAAAKNSTITTSLPGNLGSMYADPTRLQQIVWNLLSNAIKFTPAEGVVELRARRTSTSIEITVKDNGEGIEPSFLPHVFEPFRQAESPNTRVHGGLGLGLSIVRYLTEAQGGTIAADSKGKGEGATFTLTLPIGAPSEKVPVQRHLTTHYNPGAQTVARKLANVKILVVDDDPETRTLVQATLREAGANVTAVGSATDALGELDKQKPDLVLTDIAMPNFDGRQLSREIRKRPDAASMKIVALSAFPNREAESRDFDAYLAKPIDPFKIVDAIAAMLKK